MNSGRIDYSPDYKSEKRYPDPRKVFDGMERRAELQRLKDAVVEAATEWAKLRFQPHFGGMNALENKLQEAARAVIEFEAKENAETR